MLLLPRTLSSPPEFASVDIVFGRESVRCRSSTGVACSCCDDDWCCGGGDFDVRCSLIVGGGVGGGGDRFRRPCDGVGENDESELLRLCACLLAFASTTSSSCAASAYILTYSSSFSSSSSSPLVSPSQLPLLLAL